jgi:hypothetical protein
MFQVKINTRQETTEGTESCSVYIETKIRAADSQLITFKN